MGCCGKGKQSENSYAKLSKMTEKGYGTMEGKCELLGFKFCEIIDKGEITLEKALDDIVEFTRSHNMKATEVQFCWLSLHLALGLCFNYKVTDKNVIRRFLLELLPYSRGIDMGLFMRDFLHYEDLSPTNEILEKAYYAVSAAAGFRVNLKEDDLANKLFKGPARIVYRNLIEKNTCYYLELPIGHPTLLMSENTSSDNHIGTQCLTLACESLKPEVVLILLRNGAQPSGKPLEHLLSTLGSQNILEEATGHAVNKNPIDLVQDCLEYCLRATKHLNVNFDGQTVADLKRKNHEVYYMRESATTFLPKDCYMQPRKLKHLCRYEIRDILLKNDNLPSGINQLPILSKELVRYIDLLC